RRVELLRQRGHRGEHRLGLRGGDGRVPHSFGRAAPMGSKTDKALRDAREYIHAAAIGVDRKRKKALLGKPTTPVQVKPDTDVAGLLDSYREASFQARALGNCAAIFDAMQRDKDGPKIFLGLARSLLGAGMQQGPDHIFGQKKYVDDVTTSA